MRNGIAIALVLMLASCSGDEADAPRKPMTFPPRPVATLAASNVQHFDVALAGDSPGQSMRLWIYLPPGNHATRSLPCVLIAPAGSNLVTGMTLGDGDRPEHLPYAAAGFAVVAYELDGAQPEEAGSDAALTGAIKGYLASKGGVYNAQTALDYIGERVPEVDPTRVYAAGHSSAGTVALVLGASEPRVKGVVAYAPAVDIRAFLGVDAVRSLSHSIPKMADFLDSSSPDQRIADMKSPVMLFAARDDDTVKAQSVIDFAHAMKEAGKSADLVVVETGGHHDAMLEKGIPAGIAWLKKLDAKGRQQ